MNFYKAHYLAVITATLVLVACGGGSAGGGGGGFGGGLGPGPGDLSSLFENTPDSEEVAQAEAFNARVRQKSALFNQNIIQTSEEYGALTGIYETSHQSDYKNGVTELLAISPKGYVFSESLDYVNCASRPGSCDLRSYVSFGNVSGSLARDFSIVLDGPSFNEMTASYTSGGNIFVHSLTYTGARGLSLLLGITTHDLQILFRSPNYNEESSSSTREYTPINQNEVYANDNVLGTPLRPGIYWYSGIRRQYSGLDSTGYPETQSTGIFKIKGNMPQVTTRLGFRATDLLNSDAFVFYGGIDNRGIDSWISFYFDSPQDSDRELHDPFVGVRVKFTALVPSGGDVDIHFLTEDLPPDFHNNPYLLYTPELANEELNSFGSPNDERCYYGKVTVSGSNEVEHQLSFGPVNSACSGGFVIHTQDSDDTVRIKDIEFTRNIFEPSEFVMLRLDQNGVLSEVINDFGDNVAQENNNTCKINGLVDAPPNTLGLDTFSVLDASVAFDSCNFMASTDNLNTILIPYKHSSGRGFRMINAFTEMTPEGFFPSEVETSEVETIAIRSMSFEEVCRSDGTLTMEAFENAGYVCLFDSAEGMFVPTPPSNFKEDVVVESGRPDSIVIPPDLIGLLDEGSTVTIKGSFTSGGLIFIRPPTVDEIASNEANDLTRDTERTGQQYFRKFSHSNSVEYCVSQGGRLATSSEVMEHIAPKNPRTGDSSWNTELYWPQTSHYWTATVAEDNTSTPPNRFLAWITYNISNGNLVQQLQSRTTGYAITNRNLYWPLCVGEI